MEALLRSGSTLPPPLRSCIHQKSDTKTPNIPLDTFGGSKGGGSATFCLHLFAPTSATAPPEFEVSVASYLKGMFDEEDY